MMNTRMLATAIVILAASLTGCASSPRYVAADGANDYGYSSRQISEGRYRVNFNGSRRAGLEETRDYALLRAAQLTLANDYDWFRIIDRETSTVTESREPRTGVAFQRTYDTRTDCGLLACTRSTRPVTRTTYSVDMSRPSEKHAHSIEILMGKGDLPEDGSGYDASEIVKIVEDRA